MCTWYGNVALGSCSCTAVAPATHAVSSGASSNLLRLSQRHRAASLRHVRPHRQDFLQEPSVLSMRDVSVSMKLGAGDPKAPEKQSFKSLGSQKPQCHGGKKKEQNQARRGKARHVGHRIHVEKFLVDSDKAVPLGFTAHRGAEVQLDLHAVATGLSPSGSPCASRLAPLPAEERV